LDGNGDNVIIKMNKYSNKKEV